eukprot:scaffold2671_cov167-Amphora_coffeaeformis.AAC.10
MQASMGWSLERTKTIGERYVMMMWDNLASQEHDSQQEPPKPPRSAFMCFTDAKKKELLERDGLPQNKKEVLNLVASEWRKLSDGDRAFWDEEARNDKVRFVREKEQYKGEWVIPKRRAKKDPRAPKRPMSAFLKYSKTRRSKVKEENPDMSNTDISRLLGEMWRNASQAERAPYVESEQQERAAYKEQVKQWREKQATADAASRTSHHMVHQVPRPHYHDGSSFDPFMRVHSVEEAVQKADRSFATMQMEDYAPEPLPSRRSPQNAAKPTPYGYGYGGYRNHENEFPPRHAHPGHNAYPFRPYPPSSTAPPGLHSPDSSPEHGPKEEGEHCMTTSRYFDRPRYSPFGFYHYP